MTTAAVDEADLNRRDFLYIATGSMAAVGLAAAAWPFIDAMNPSAEVRGQAAVNVDLTSMEAGQRVTVKWRGKPVFIDRRTSGQIESAVADDAAELRDPQSDADRVEDAEWLIVVGICTHLGCVPLGQKVGEPVGDWGGWFCPCHGSHYDTSGRIRKGPAPKNLVVPPYVLVPGEKVTIG
ncbi:ubiquinol-cytochrome c reductase iron-sulfur subunit [Stappia sp. F7233]|uniref:Ubiquinol-cytochrome c reductase iron-sulfur subunit n=1 Tax=Stappia albiluteola TaxID=2758565 RepID=A0A839A9S1_9HYPH|nr:ubiquinol-cytochrome c reductase iron-sulfur subunit [Stappia albiluteola]MBA5775519.1 ubiquinol-cytochrome c reductase iron-sulfur subunit [Stappia albiluteola]